jgi:hypothetical protein
MGGTQPLRVKNAHFLLERLSADTDPLQQYRELTQNGLEAILALSTGEGTVFWDVDWYRVQSQGVYKLTVIDTGVGMSKHELLDYINQLSSTSGVQALGANFGVGAKITAGARNPAGLLYASWKDGKGWMVNFWRDPDLGFGLEQFQLPNDVFAHCVAAPDALKPEIIDKHGTMVVLGGADPDQNTVVAPPNILYPSHWLTRYLNRRYFTFPEGIQVKVREFSKRDPAEWPVEPSIYMRDGAMVRAVTGQREKLEKHKEASGQVDLHGATAHWWLLKADEKALKDQAGLWQASGHVASLYQNELYEMRDGVSGKRMLQQFGILFGNARVVIYVEPTGAEHQVISNTARSQLLIDGAPLPWGDWADEFRGKIPQPLIEMMDAILAAASASSYRDAIRERLKNLRDLFRVTRYRRTTDGPLATQGDVAGGRPAPHDRVTRGSSPSSGRSGGTASKAYGALLAEVGDAAEPVVPRDMEPKTLWVSIADKTREAGDNLEDRAAAYIPSSHELQINRDFRIYRDMIKHWNEKYEGVAGAPEVIQSVVEEWFEQQLIESVLGVRSLEGTRSWSDDELERALSEEALTACVMPRYHVYNQIKRTLGSRLGGLRPRTSSSLAPDEQSPVTS